MAATIIDGKAIAAEIREEIAARVSKLPKPVGLAAILVGDDEASAVYVRGKEKAAASVGIDSYTERLPASTSPKELLATIDRLNADDRVNGIIVQIPLPEGIDEVQAQEAVDPAKDVDGLHPYNAGSLVLGRPRFVPCTPLGVKVILERSGIKTEGSEVVVVGRSNLVGRPLSILLSQKARGANATVTLCHTGTVDLASHTLKADVLVAATGAPRSITADMVKPGATVIDVGITRHEGKLTGDVDPAVEEVAGALTPVPGGVGPLTVAMLLQNTLFAAERDYAR